MVEDKSRPRLIRLWRVFSEFLTLGCFSFGGPVAHIGFFRQRFVHELGWMAPEVFGRQLVLAQCLPGPSSSQLGFLIGRYHAGFLGAVLAFVGFTLPSFMLMTMLAVTGQTFWQAPWMQGIVSGLLLFAIAVASLAAFDLLKQFCQTRLHGLLCAATVVFLLGLSLPCGAWLALLICGCIGFLVSLKTTDTQGSGDTHHFTKITWLPLLLWLVLFGLCASDPFLQPLQGLFWTGSSVIGGGHVVLPFLIEQFQSVLPLASLTAGYSSAQLLPGPLFTIGAYIGVLLMPEHFWTGALLGCLLLFTPGLLFVLACCDVWDTWQARAHIQQFFAAACACATGILIAALYSPLFVQSIHSAQDFAFVVFGILLVRFIRMPLIVIAVGFALLGYYFM